VGLGKNPFLLKKGFLCFRTNINIQEAIFLTSIPIYPHTQYCTKYGCLSLYFNYKLIQQKTNKFTKEISSTEYNFVGTINNRSIKSEGIP